jgi:hypothetical protein
VTPTCQVVRVKDEWGTRYLVSVTHWREVSFIVNRSKVVEELQRPHEGLRGRRVHEVKVNLRRSGRGGQ